MDILHVATAQQIRSTELLSFDENQRRVAEAEGLAASP
jgi:predicted nucleic acid-binding protein